MSEITVVVETNDIIVNPSEPADIVVRPVNRDIVLLPRTTEITLDGDTTNFAIVGEATVHESNVALQAMTQFTLVVETPTGFEPADAGNINHFKYACGFLLNSVIAGQVTPTLIDGKIENPAWTFNVGDPLFMSAVVPGTVVTAPDAGSVFFRQVGWVLTPTKLLVNQYEGTLGL